MKLGNLCLFTATSAISLAAAAPSLAQDAAAPSAAEPASHPGPKGAQRNETMVSDDIVVTARRVEERLQDVPISITVFNQDQLTNRNVVNAQDLAAYTPSLSSNTNFGSENSTFAIRGFVQDIGTPPSVGVYFADVVAPRGAAQGTPAGEGAGPGSFFDLQNVQVLKGPQGTLFGRNTTGGAILLVPQKPTAVLGGYVEGSLGNYGMRRIQGAINLPISDFARFRLSIDDQQRDGYLKNSSGIGPRDYNDVNYTAVRASLVVDVAAGLENYTVASFSKSDTHGSAQKLIACSPLLAFGAPFACPQIAAQNASGDGFYGIQTNLPNPVSNLEQWQVINTTTWLATDTVTIKNIVSYAQLRNRQRSPLFATNWSLGIPLLGVPVQQIPFASLNPIPGGRTASQSTFTEELQVQGQTGKLSYQVGAYMERSAPLETVGAQSPVLIGCTDLDALQCTDVIGIGASAAAGFAFPINVGAVNYTAGRTNFRNFGIYSQATYKVSDQIRATGGIRYTWDEQRNTSRRISYAFPVLPPFTGPAAGFCTDFASSPSCVETLRQKSSKPTWLIGLDYTPDEDVLVYAKYTRGYRSGGIFPNGPQEYRIFEPEKVDSYEVGLKTSFLDPVRGNFNISGFYNDFSNQQLQASFVAAPGAPVAPTTGVVNAGRSRIWGFELETTISPFEGFRLDASYTYLNARIREIAPILVSDPNYLVDIQINPGDSLFLSPDNKASVTAAYTLPIDKSMGRLTFSATYSFTDKQRTNYLYNTPAMVSAYGKDLGIIDSYSLLNLNINWNRVAGSPIDLGLFATNVTKNKYYTFVPGLGSSGLEVAAIGEPRMYGARLRVNFGD